jgi:hypothetical protein
MERIRASAILKGFQSRGKKNARLNGNLTRGGDFLCKKTKVAREPWDRRADLIPPRWATRELTFPR